MLEGGLQYLVYKPLGIILEDINGTPRTIHGCSLDNLKKLSALMDVIWREANQQSQKDPTLSIQQIFLTNTFFAQLCVQAIELCGISAGWVDVNMLCQLLFPFEFSGKTLKDDQLVDMPTQVVDGILMQLNFPRSASPSIRNNPSNTTAQKRASWDDMLASLWLSTKNLSTARDVASSMPWNELSQVMLSRNDALLPPEEKERKDTIEAYQELINKTRETARNEQELSQQKSLLSKIFSNVDEPDFGIEGDGLGENFWGTDQMPDF